MRCTRANEGAEAKCVLDLGHRGPCDTSYDFSAYAKRLTERAKAMKHAEVQGALVFHEIAVRVYRDELLSRG